MTTLIMGVQFLGCRASPDRTLAPVAGTVRYHGQPLPHGQVVMVHESGHMAAVAIQADGSYHLEAALGENQVMIVCTDLTDPSQLNRQGGIPLRRPKSLIPERYNNCATSGLTLNVADGDNRGDWNLAD